MYIPSSFAQPDREKLLNFISKNSFATIVSSDHGELEATHMPLLLEVDGQNSQLVGHLAKANDQWKAADDQTVLVIFSGPHTYISPTWYEAPNTVPTWNYTAVHVYGTMRVVHEPERLKEIVGQYVDTYEANMEKPWSLDLVEEELMDKLVKMIVGFTIDIERIEGKWKLNQNHDQERREQVISALRISGNPDQVQIAEIMEKEHNNS